MTLTHYKICFIEAYRYDPDDLSLPSLDDVHIPFHIKQPKEGDYIVRSHTQDYAWHMMSKEYFEENYVTLDKE